MPQAQTYQSEFTGLEMDARFTAVAQLTDALEALTTVVAQKYVKPASGIPSTDLDADVNAALAKANSAIQSLADYYTKSEVDQLLAAINGMDYVDVATLPTASASTLGKIYLVGPDGSGYYAYYYTSYDGSAYSWVGPLGTTQISLANYATKAELSQLDQKVTELDDVQDAFVTVTKKLTITKDDFSLSGIYSTSAMEVSSNANYKSTPIYQVQAGDVFEWSGFPTPNSTDFILSMYASDNSPFVVGTNNRHQYAYLQNGKFTVPQGCSQIGFVWRDATFPLTAQSQITCGQDTLALTQEAVAMIKEDCGINDLAEDVAAVSETIETVDAMVEHIPEQIVTPSDFTITGLWKTGAAEIDPSYTNYRAIALVNVVQGQVITFHHWQKSGASSFPSVAAVFIYDNDGLPIGGTSARRNYSEMTTLDYTTGDYTFVIPAGCSQLGLAFNFSTYPAGADGYIAISAEKYELTDLAKELVNNAVEAGHMVGDDSSKYYLKGNSNIVYSSAKKIGIIAAGQSNIDGRNSYSDLPSGFVNPNAKVRFCNNPYGTFSDFQVTDGGQGNDWSFDAIVYDLLTKSAYGNQSEIFVMKKSMGGTSIDPLGETDYHWTADYEFLESASASLVRSFETIVRKGVELQGANFDIKAMLWHQGEGDMQNEAVASRYYENLKNMLAYVRGVVGNPRLHVFCGNISLNRTTPGYVAIINAAYTQLASEDPYLHVVDMSNAQLEDGYHFNYEWSIYFGQKVYDLMIDAGIISGTKINPSEPS